MQMHYCGKEIHQVFKLEDGVVLVLTSQDEGRTWYVKVSDDHGTIVHTQSLSRALGEAGLVIMKVEDVEATTGVLERAIRWWSKIPGDHAKDLLARFVEVYEKLTGEAFSG